MENSSQLPASMGLRRENESMDDFEHLEAESTSPVKEVFDKLNTKDSKLENLKTDKESSTPLVKVPAESRNSSDFSLLSDSKLDSPVTDNSSVFTMEDTARKLEELTSTLKDRNWMTEDVPAESARQPTAEIDMFSKFDSKVDPGSVLQSFLTSEKVGSVSDVLKDGIGMPTTADLLSFEATSSVGDKSEDILSKHSIPLIKDDDDSFKDTIPELIRPEEKFAPLDEVKFIEPVVEDTFKDVIPDTIVSSKGNESSKDEGLLPKYKSDHEDDEEFNLAASQDSSPIKMADKLEQYNIKPTHEITSKTEQSEPSHDDSLMIEGEKVSLGGPTSFVVKEPVVDEKPIVPKPAKTHTDIPVIAPASLTLPLDSWFKPERLHPRVENLVYWRNPKVSGAVLGIGLALLLSLAYCSLISVIAYVSLAVLIGCGGFRLYRAVMAAVNKTGEGHPFRELLDQDIAMSPDRAASLAQQIVPHINASIAELRRLFLVEDILDTFKFGVMVWALTYVGAIFNGLTLVILAYVSAFTLPRLYENNKQQIDKNLELVRAQIAEITAKVQAFNPLSGAAAKKLSGAAAGSEEKKEN